MILVSRVQNNDLFQMGNGKIAQLWAARLHNAMTRRNLDMIPYAESCWRIGLLGLIHGYESVRMHQKLLPPPTRRGMLPEFCVLGEG